MDWLTEITGTPVWMATRSAVRCLVPDSWVSMLESGTSCTAARRMLPASLSQMMAPSILASSRSLVGEKSIPISNPPEQMDSMVRSEPRTINAPVRPRRMRSRPSRRAVPGATLPRVALSESSGLRAIGFPFKGASRCLQVCRFYDSAGRIKSTHFPTGSILGVKKRINRTDKPQSGPFGLVLPALRKAPGDGGGRRQLGRPPAAPAALR
ncbi:hypothetical protein D9M72_324790 [compost metagenome]